MKKYHHRGHRERYEVMRSNRKRLAKPFVGKEKLMQFEFSYSNYFISVPSVFSVVNNILHAGNQREL
jgi:hypothetical protein